MLEIQSIPINFLCYNIIFAGSRNPLNYLLECDVQNSMESTESRDSRFYTIV